MLVIRGIVTNRMRGKYKTKDGNEKEKLVYIITDNNISTRVTVWDNQIYEVGTLAEIPVYITTFIATNGQAKYTLNKTVEFNPYTDMETF